MSNVVDQTVRAAVIRGRTALYALLPGQKFVERKRWLVDVLRVLDETEGTREAAIAALWRSHQEGEIVLSRCDLPHGRDPELLAASEITILGATYHFAQLVPETTILCRALVEVAQGRAPNGPQRLQLALSGFANATAHEARNELRELRSRGHLPPGVEIPGGVL